MRIIAVQILARVESVLVGNIFIVGGSSDQPSEWECESFETRCYQTDSKVSSEV